MNYLIENARIGGKIGSLAVRDGKIADPGSLEGEYERIDAGGLILRPGLVDLHSHGNSGLDTMEGGLSEMSSFQFFHGVTSWLPTTMTMPIDEIARATAVIPPRGRNEARIMGFHMEGPFVSPKYCGAQNPAFLRTPDVSTLETIHNIAMVTIAPELPDSLAYIREATKRGIRVSLGHSDATYDQTVAAIKAGAVCLTHAFNAMAPFRHREPGLIGAALTEGSYVQVISDGIHLHPATVLGLYRMFGPDRMLLISDSLRATGLSDGEYSFGGQPIFVKDGVARIAAGNIAGSTSTLYDCVRKAVSMGIPEDDAYRMASETPARLMGWKKGRLESGYDAEFILCREDGTLAGTIIQE